MKRIWGHVLCYFGRHEWESRLFTWVGGSGIGRECVRCNHYELLEQNWSG